MSTEILEIVQNRLDNLIRDTDDIINNSRLEYVGVVYKKVLNLHAQFLKDLRTDLQDSKPPELTRKCTTCGRELLEGMDVYTVNKAIVCSDCCSL